MKIQYVAVLAFTLAAFSTPPAFAQVVRPYLAPPPCTGNYCLRHRRNAQTPATNPKRRKPCPRGTVYDPHRGACKVNGVRH